MTQQIEFYTLAFHQNLETGIAEFSYQDPDSKGPLLLRVSDNKLRCGSGGYIEHGSGKVRGIRFRVATIETPDQNFLIIFAEAGEDRDRKRFFCVSSRQQIADEKWKLQTIRDFVTDKLTPGCGVVNDFLDDGEYSEEGKTNFARIDRAEWLSNLRGKLYDLESFIPQKAQDSTSTKTKDC